MVTVMNDEQKIRYQILKDKNFKAVKESSWNNDVLFQECIDSLKEYHLLSLEESAKVFKEFEKNYPITLSGHIDWKKFNGIVSEDGMPYIYENVDLHEKFYILWDKQDIPCVICELTTILGCMDDVLAVSFNTWLLSLDTNEVIEFYHEGRITYGKLR